MIEDYKESYVRLDLVDKGTWDNSPGTYAGLDRFGQVRQQWWWRYKPADTGDVHKFAYGYDRNSNRTWLDHPAATMGQAPYCTDHLYTQDKLNRLGGAEWDIQNGNRDDVIAALVQREVGAHPVPVIDYAPWAWSITPS